MNLKREETILGCEVYAIALTLAKMAHLFISRFQLLCLTTLIDEESRKPLMKQITAHIDAVERAAARTEAGE